MNNWGIPAWLDDEVRARDKTCVYCGVQMVEKIPRGISRKNASTWEHIINDARIITRENIARCCASCNSSKGTKALSDWMLSAYCKNKGITEDNVANVVKEALETARKQCA
jgi:hypothetical protein